MGCRGANIENLAMGWKPAKTNTVDKRSDGEEQKNKFCRWDGKSDIKNFSVRMDSIIFLAGRWKNAKVMNLAVE